MRPLADFESTRHTEKTCLQLKSEVRWSNFYREKQVALTTAGFQEKILSAPLAGRLLGQCRRHEVHEAGGGMGQGF